MSTRNNTAGFTIIELLISMTVFSLMLITASLVILQIGKMYYKGVNNIRTQDSINDVIAGVTEQAQFSTGIVQQGSTQYGTVSDPVTVNSRCIGTTRYSFVLQRRLVPNQAYNTAEQQMPHVLWQDKQTDDKCTPVNITQVNIPATETTDGKELLRENSRLISFDINSPNPPPVGSDVGELVNISVNILSGDNDLLERVDNANAASDATGCKGGVVGSEWCASAQLNTQIMRRMR